MSRHEKRWICEFKVRVGGLKYAIEEQKFQDISAHAALSPIVIPDDSAAREHDADSNAPQDSRPPDNMIPF